MMHKTDNGIVISSVGSWRPGVYDCERAARYAARFSDEVLQRLQDSTNGGVISLAMLQAERRAR